MKNVVLMMFSLCFLHVKGQETSQVDTLQILSLKGIKSMSMTRTGQDTICKIDGEIVSYTEYRNLLNRTLIPKTCKPCYIQVVDRNNRLTEEGLYYVGNKKGFEKEISVPFAYLKSKKVHFKEDSYFDGPVKYYKKNGKLKKIVHYNQGKKW